MSAPNSESTTTTDQKTSNDSLLQEVELSSAPIVALLTGQGLKPVHQMSPEELRLFVRRLREARTAAVQTRAALEAEARVKGSKEKSSPKPKADLSIYE